jgi:hypothetical protein
MQTAAADSQVTNLFSSRAAFTDERNYMEVHMCTEGWAKKVHNLLSLTSEPATGHKPEPFPTSQPTLLKSIFILTLNYVLDL